MRTNFRYGGALAMVAAVFCMVGPVATKASQIPGTSVPTCAGTCGLKAPAAHLSGIAGTSIVLTSTIKRSSDSNGYGRERLGLPGQRDRMLQWSDRCGWWDGEWRCGDFDHFHHHHHHHYRHYGHYSYYSHYSHYGHYGHYSRYSRYSHYGRYGHHGYGRYSHYGRYSRYSRYGYGHYR
jgi:hypothetical protein